MTDTDQPSQASPPVIARGLAEFASALQPSALSAGLRRKATHHIVDAIGLAFASQRFAFAAPALRGFAAAGAAGDATVIGSASSLAPRDAALSNGFLMHGLDFDDTHPLAIVHPTVACLPAALAVGEAVDADWDDMLAAYVAGMEVAIRLGVAVKGGFHHAGFHATGIVAHFSSAIVAGKLMKLDAAQLVAAQGIAASTAAGVQVFLEEGAWTKRMHPGWGALAGITAAHLAANGFAGPSRPYEGRFGLFDSHLQEHAGAIDLESISKGLGDEWTMFGTAIKPYPVCHFIHGCAEAALRLHDAQMKADDIEEIVCLLPAPTMPIVAEPAVAKMTPKTDYDAKFSTHFVVVACLLRGRFGLAELEDDVLRDPGILKLAAKVRCAVDPDADFPRYFSGRVTVRMHDGSQRSEHVPINLGSGERALGEHEIARKFRGTAGLMLSPDRVDTLLDALLSPGKRKVRAMMQLLRAA
ncbi:putative MmgE/PrpD family protein [Paraburkholderia piptadeniae]|uniref:MmgE/PrpD family protein n=1 Tax=Paraburkholderia piptadeniae TaxID=1701573 RepID=A0A1N7SDM6_9BURK|nr:MmgE/PrpD family protein [Paraburkholderia piptadeniae]SIT45505.1 putative MmgE/PrpD family protein [Paraburkholderia piptadeniae]